MSGWASWLRGLVKYLRLRLSGGPQPLVQCLHPAWSSCKFGRRWCLSVNCSKWVPC